MTLVNLKDVLVVIAVIAWTANAAYAYNNTDADAFPNGSIVVASN